MTGDTTINITQILIAFGGLFLAGLTLLPQAGVANGMALPARQRFPNIKNIILPLVPASIVIFEFSGPVLTRWTLGHAVCIKQNRNSSEAT